MLVEKITNEQVTANGFVITAKKDAPVKKNPRTRLDKDVLEELNDKFDADFLKLTGTDLYKIVKLDVINPAKGTATVCDYAIAYAELDFKDKKQHSKERGTEQVIIYAILVESEITMVADYVNVDKITCYFLGLDGVVLFNS